MSAIEADMAWNRGAPCKISNSLSRYTFLVLFYYYFLFLSKWSSKWRSLYIWGEICVGHWESSGAKQGNTLKKFQITNQIKLFLFDQLWFYFYFNKFIKGKIFAFVREKICWPFRQIRPETGEYLAIFNL